MTRNEYLSRCRAFAVLPKGVREQPLGNGHSGAKVLYYGKEYYAKAYQLEYKPDGSPRYTAILRETDCNSVRFVPLDSLVEPH